MKPKVFISWSGEKSKKIAEILKNRLPAVIQNIDPYFTPDDIEKGKRWSGDIADSLNNSNIGIICLTKENMMSPWILFEAGALSKQIESSNVCTLLIDIKPSDLVGPLSQFQATSLKKNDLMALFKTINNSTGEEALEKSILVNVFEHWWDVIENEFNDVLEFSGSDNNQTLREDRDLLEEILLLSRKLYSNRSNSTSLITEPLFTSLLAMSSQYIYLVGKDKIKDYSEDDFGDKLKGLGVTLILLLKACPQNEISKFYIEKIYEINPQFLRFVE